LHDFVPELEIHVVFINIVLPSFNGKEYKPLV